MEKYNEEIPAEISRSEAEVIEFLQKTVPPENQPNERAPTITTLVPTPSSQTSVDSALEALAENLDEAIVNMDDMDTDETHPVMPNTPTNGDQTINTINENQC